MKNKLKQKLTEGWPNFRVHPTQSEKIWLYTDHFARLLPCYFFFFFQEVVVVVKVKRLTTSVTGWALLYMLERLQQVFYSSLVSS